MTLEELIYSRLAGDKSVLEKLAGYGDAPALFLQKAPDDSDPAWQGAQYPRAEYLVDMTADPERHSSGVVTVHIYSSDSGTPPEDIAPDVRQALSGVLMQADDGAYSATWDHTELFEMRTSMNPNTLVNGCTLTFLLIAFPAQETKTPDPALALQEFLKSWEPAALIIGKDKIETIYEPSEEHPAFYVRVASYRTNRQTFALTWMDCIISIHVIAPTPESRNIWCRYLSDALHQIGEVTMLDGSPMMISDVAVDNSAEHMTRGQISIKTQYSIPKTEPCASPLNHILIMQERRKERNGN